MAMIPAAARAAGAGSLLGQAARYVAGQAIAGAVEGGAQRARKRAFAATSGESTGGHATSTATKAPRQAPRLANKQMRMAVERCCLSMLENKVAYTTQSNSTAQDTFRFDLVNNIGNGNGQGQRVGRKIHNGFLKVKVTITAASGTVSDFCRWGVIIDTMPDGSPITAAEVFQDITRGATTMYLNHNVGRGRRFIIVKDARIALNSDGSPGRRVFDVGIPLRCVTQYNDVGTTINDISTNAIYVFYYGQNTLDDSSQWQWDAELFYKDG